MPIDAFPTIAALVELQRRGQATAVEVTSGALARIAAGRSNAVIVVDPEGALHAAAAIDRRRAAGLPLGALAGVPVTVKDSFAVAGMHTCDGSPDAVAVAAADAPAVARLREAGAIIVGKTNVPTHLADLQSQNALHGRTLNPHDPRRTPGGSSGGAAAAVAAGLSSGDVGSDLGGSIRVPAAWCGVVGHRPSNGVVSKRGHLPWPLDGRVDVTASAAGPIARTAADARALLQVMAGAAGAEARVWQAVLPPSRVTSLKTLRIGFWTEPSLPIDAETGDALEAVVTALAAAGASVTSVTGSPLADADAASLYKRLTEHEIAWTVPVVRSAPIDEVWADWDRQRRIRDAWESSLDEANVDLVIAPVVPHTAPVHSNEPLPPDAGRWSITANLGTGPSTVVPLGLGAHSALPVAAQLIGRYGDDLTTLGVAELLEASGLSAAPVPLIYSQEPA